MGGKNQWDDFTSAVQPEYRPNHPALIVPSQADQSKVERAPRRPQNRRKVDRDAHIAMIESKWRWFLEIGSQFAGTLWMITS